LLTRKLKLGLSVSCTLGPAGVESRSSEFNLQVARC